MESNESTPIESETPCPACVGTLDGTIDDTGLCNGCGHRAFDQVDFETHAEVLTDLRNRGADEDSVRTPQQLLDAVENALERIKAARRVLTNGEIPPSLRIKTALKIL